MKSHKLELNLDIQHFDSTGKLKNSYVYPYKENVENTITFTVKDENNQEVYNKTFPVRSFVSNWIKVFSSTWAANTESVTSPTGSLISLNGLTSNILKINALAGDSTYGIWVGNGVVLSSSINSYQILSQVLHGSGSSQCLYKDTTLTPVVSYGGGYRLVLRREFTNVSGGAINLSTAGLLVKLGTGDIYLGLIDLTDETNTPIYIPVVNNQTAIVEYHFDISSSGDYTQNWLKCLYSAFGSASVQMQTTTYDTVGSQSIVYSNHAYWRGDAGVNVDTWGIVVGSGSGGKDINSYKLSSQIQQGSGSGQMVYGATTGESVFINAPNAQVAFKRSFTNNSGGALSISESAIYMHGAALGGGGFPVDTQDNQKTCVARSVFTAFTVGNGESFQIRYTSQVTN